MLGRSATKKKVWPNLEFYQPFTFAAIISELEYVCRCMATNYYSNTALMSEKVKVLRSDYEIREVSRLLVITGKKYIPTNPFCRVVSQ